MERTWFTLLSSLLWRFLIMAFGRRDFIFKILEKVFDNTMDSDEALEVIDEYIMKIIDSTTSKNADTKCFNCEFKKYFLDIAKNISIDNNINNNSKIKNIKTLTKL